ncbi:MAG: metallophosphoesterase [Pseudomonadota bacterium]
MLRYFLFCVVFAGAISSLMNSCAVQAKVTSADTHQRQVPQRIIAIGDLHGNLSVTKRALVLAGAIDQNDRWIGGELVVVQVGDLIDRGANDKAVIDFLETLKKQAKQAGGQLITLLGNHEFMNVLGDYRYVSKEGVDEFKVFSKNEDPYSGRFQAFKPGGPYARTLAHNPVTIVIGDTLFVHAGLRKCFLYYGLERINKEAQQFLRGELKNPPQFVIDSDGPIWTRRYSKGPSREDCAELKQVLSQLNCTRMVVGHTVQSDGIASTCDGMCWMVDIGLTFSPDKVEVLEITPSGLKVLKEHSP